MGAVTLLCPPNCLYACIFQTSGDRGVVSTKSNDLHRLRKLETFVTRDVSFEAGAMKRKHESTTGKDLRRED